MRADYDSEADALMVTLQDQGHWDGSVEVDDTYCRVAFSGGKPASIELLSPARALEFIPKAAEVAGVDARYVEAAVRAALAAPDHEITLEFADELYASNPLPD